MREVFLAVMDTFHNQTDSALHLLKILDILIVYQLSDLKVLHLQHKGLLKCIPSRIIFNMQVVFMDATPGMLPNKMYLNLKCAITLENKHLSIQELIFMTKSFQTYYNLKSSISLSNTLNICLNIYLIIIIINMITLFSKYSSFLPCLFNLSNSWLFICTISQCSK